MIRQEVETHGDVDVVIVNWNGGQLVIDCVSSLVTFGESIAKIIVVDNGSSDGSQRKLALSDKVSVIENGDNLGFARGCNIGSKHGKSKYILFFNPDARMIDSSLNNIIEFMNTDEAKNIGICGARLVGDDGETQRSCANFTNASTYIGGAFGLNDIFPKIFTPLFSTFDYNVSRVVDQPIGAYFLIRREIFERIDGFDERFFVYFEEVDLALRVKQAGWDSFYFAEAVAYHKGGGASERVRAGRLFYTLRSRLLYAQKNFSNVSFVSTVAASLVLEPIGRLTRACLRRSGGDLVDTMKAYGLLWRDMPGIVRSMKRNKSDA